MSFRWSQRETWTTRGSSGENGPAPPITAGVRTDAAPSSNPILAKRFPTRARDSGRFLAESGSMEGSMIHTSAPASRAGTKAACEKTKVRQWARCGWRKLHASSVNVFVRSDPMWQRQATCTP